MKQAVLAAEAGGLGIHLQDLPLNGDFMLSLTALCHSEASDKALLASLIQSCSLFLL
jgi:hypothetical protein